VSIKRTKDDTLQRTILAQFNVPTQKTQNNISDHIRISLPPYKSFKSTQIQVKITETSNETKLMYCTI
jgi:hypothetical protein